MGVKVTLREERSLKVFRKRVLRRKYGPPRERELHFIERTS